MIERLAFLVVYVGTAALAALLAVCLSSPRVDTFVCGTTGPDGSERCELVDSLAALASESAGMVP